MVKEAASSTKLGSTEDTSQEQPRLTASKRRWFILLSMVLPIAAVLFSEGVLRLSGHGGYVPTVREVGTEGGRTLVITDTSGAATYFDASKTSPGSVNQFDFFDPKPSNTIRIVLAGGSAIKGFPQPRGFAPSAFLGEMLSDAWPDRRVEVINLGTTAVASFPVLSMLTEMLEYDPDLVVIYSGHNEFFGAYGVASRHYTASAPWAMKIGRAYGSTALGQFLATIRTSERSSGGKALMEAVVGRAFIGSDSPLREAAAHNLYTHITEMIQHCQAKAVPVIVCTLASNERDLAPIGTCDDSKLDPADRDLLPLSSERFSRSQATAKLAADLETALANDPNHALLHYRLGQVYEALDESAALEHYRLALDLDPMPWRAPGRSIDAIRQAAHDHEAVLCDVQQAFRDVDQFSVIGEDLMADHVHPTLKGQWLVARSVVDALGSFEGKLRVTKAALDELGSFDFYAQRLGDNRFDRLGVLDSLFKVFDVPFMRQSNPDAVAHVERQLSEALAGLSITTKRQVDKWTDPKSHSGFKIPLSGMVAQVLMSQGKLPEAEKLFSAARNHVPTYSGPYFEYSCFALACRRQIQGSLSQVDQDLAKRTIEQISLFLTLADKSSGQPERFMGRLYQLLDDHISAIKHLQDARGKLAGDNLVKAELALVASYAQTGDLQSARQILSEGALRGGSSAATYRQLLSRMTSP